MQKIIPVQQGDEGERFYVSIPFCVLTHSERCEDMMLHSFGKHIQHMHQVISIEITGEGVHS